MIQNMSNPRSASIAMTRLEAVADGGGVIGESSFSRRLGLTISMVSVGIIETSSFSRQPDDPRTLSGCRERPHYQAIEHLAPRALQVDIFELDRFHLNRQDVCVEKQRSVAQVDLSRSSERRRKWSHQ